MQIGKKIRDLRLRRGLTVQQLATAAGLSKGFISQVENDRTSPSLTTLSDVAKALVVSVAYLVVDEDPVPYVVRAHERTRLEVGGNASRVEVLSAAPKRNLELLLVEFPPGISAGDKRHYHHGEECMLVLEGNIQMVCDEHVFALGPGDSIHYDGRQPHAIENVGDGVARVITAITPAAFEPLIRADDGAAPPRRAARGDAKDG